MARWFQVPHPFAAMTMFGNALVVATQGAGDPLTFSWPFYLDVPEQTGLLPKANVLAGRRFLL